MLIYHQRNDVFHCVFRFLSILKLSENSKIELDRLKIVDFYFVFPHLLTNTTLPRVAGSSKIKKRAQTLSVPYENLPSRKILFSEMGDFQSQALDILRAKQLLNVDESNNVSLGSSFHSPEIITFLNESTYASSDFYKNVVQVLLKCNLYGPNGLKSKTGLMEYRYDAV